MPVYVSDRLTATLGVVRGSPTPTRLIQWFRGSTVISGANASTYTITSDDLGQPISVRQTESNYFGSAVATSAATEDVQVFSPSILFSASEPGVWFDPTDAANLAWRRNLLLWTDQFDNPTWVKANGGVGVVPVVTANAGTDPIGGSTADRVQFSLGGGTASGDISQLRQTVQTDSVSTYTFSFYAKSFDGSSSYQMIAFGAASAAQAVAVTGAWTRFTFTGFGPNINYSLTLRGGQTPTNSNTADILIWGAQLEVGSVATTYQPITNLNNEVIAQFPSATLYQDVAGTTPVYAPEQPVGLMLDKSRGLVRGPELVTNGNFASGTTGWSPWNTNAQISVTSGQMTVTQPVGGNQVGVGNTTAYATVVGRTYAVTMDIISYVGDVQIRVGDFNGGQNTALFQFVAVGSRTGYFVANTTATYVNVATQSAAGSTITFDNISVKELSGNHATQSTAISRPLYGIVPVSGRRNLVTWSEQFEVASAWSTNGVGTPVSVTSNAVAAPDGALTADALNFTAQYQAIGTTSPITNGVQHTFSIYLRVASGTRQIQIVTSAGTILTTFNITSSWQQFTYSGTGLTSGLWGLQDRNPSGFVSVYAWGAQLETGSTVTAYQKVTNDYDVTEAGVASVGYLRFDGTNDGMLTNSITPGTDKAQVFLGVRKLSTGFATMAELGPIINTTPGSVWLGTNDSVAQDFAFGSSGSSATYAVVDGYNSPTNNILTGLGDISGDRTTLRVNGAQVAQDTGNQGTGNYLSYPIYLGRRPDGSTPFNGQLFPMIIRFGPNMSSALIRTTENWVASKTAGVTLP